MKINKKLVIYEIRKKGHYNVKITKNMLLYIRVK